MIQPDFWNGDQFDAEAQRLYEAGDYDQALDVLKRALHRYPDSVELLISMGYTRLAREEYAWAHQSFDLALWHEPDHEEALAGIGEAKLRLGDRAGAFRAFDLLIELGFDDDIELMLCVGRSLMREGLFERAERFFRMARKADRYSSDVALDLGYVFYRIGDVRKAARWAKEAVRLDPANSDARALYGNVLYERGQFAAALGEFDRIAPTDVFDAAVAWRIIELKRRLHDLPPDAVEVRPWMLVLEELSVEPSPEDRLLAELEARAHGAPAPFERSQLDLFGRPPEIAIEEWHRVRSSDGSVFEGDWETIVCKMRDVAGDPTQSLIEYMRAEAGRLSELTGGSVSCDDARAFIEDSARVGALEIEK